MDPRALLTRLFHAAVAAADPRKALAGALPPPPKGRTVVIGAGKGAAQMAQAFEDLWPHPLEGVVVTRYGHSAPCQRIEVIEAAHPVPDAAGLAATARLQAALGGLTADDLVVALICGGGSSLLPAPPAGFTLQDEITLNQVLLASGAPIAAMNAIRRKFSTIKGGGLAQAAGPAPVVTLVVSDIPGDNPADVASGPTIPSRDADDLALRYAAQYRIALPEHILAHLGQPSPPRLSRRNDRVTVIASASRSLEAAALASPVPAVILSDAIEGEAREAGAFHAAVALEIRGKNRPFARPVVLLSGGETTVTLRGKGSGGRNSEFLLSFAGRIAGSEGIHALAADTDGIDGRGENAGAFADGTTVLRLQAANRSWEADLLANDSGTSFASLGDLFVTGPTGTNVNDFRAIYIA